jgi:hypothetical protein
MSKSARNKQQARAKIAQMRVLEARRRRRRNWLAGIGAAAVVIAAAAGITLAVHKSGGPGGAGGGWPVRPRPPPARMSTGSVARPASRLSSTSTPT